MAGEALRYRSKGKDNLLKVAGEGRGILQNAVICIDSQAVHAEPVTTGR